MRPPLRASQKSCSGSGQAAARISFAVVAHSAFPQEMHYAQQLQKIFPVAGGDHAQGSSCSVEREYCSARSWGTDISPPPTREAVIVGKCSPLLKRISDPSFLLCSASLQHESVIVARQVHSRSMEPAGSV